MLVVGLALIAASWLAAAAVVPAASKRGEWALPLVLAIGCSGPVAALLLVS